MLTFVLIRTDHQLSEDKIAKHYCIPFNALHYITFLLVNRIIKGD